MALTLTGKEGGSGAWNELDADVYDATLTGIEDAGLSKFDQKPQFKLTFTLDLQDDEGEPIKMLRWINQVLSPKSNLAAIAEACGKTWAPGQEFDAETLIGSRCRVMVNIDDEGKRKVASVLAPKGAAKATPAKAPVTKPVPAAAKAAADSNVDDVCAVEGCGEGVSKYTKKGTPLCEAHEPDDL